MVRHRKGVGRLYVVAEQGAGVQLGYDFCMMIQMDTDAQCRRKADDGFTIASRYFDLFV